MELIARTIDSWPGKLTPESQRKDTPFTAGWRETTDLLDREVGILAGHNAQVVLQLAISDRELRNDGWIRSDARPSHPGVIVSFTDLTTKRPLRFSCDHFRSNRYGGGKSLEGWKSNVRAIALSLEALRRVERYGLGSGHEQYQGWAQLGAGEPVALGDGTMTPDDAARILLDAAGQPTDDAHRAEVIANPSRRKLLYRQAHDRVHPDHAGDDSTAAAALVNTANAVVEAVQP